MKTENLDAASISNHMSNGPYYGMYGGAFIPEILVPAVQSLEKAYDRDVCVSIKRPPQDSVTEHCLVVGRII